MSGRGPDGYPLDVHPAKLPLPPQDPVWIKPAASALADRAALLAHAQAICGVPIAVRSLRSLPARLRSSHVPRISCDRRRRIDVEPACGRPCRDRADRDPPAESAGSSDADLCLARRRRPRARSVCAGRTDSVALASDRVPAWRRLVRRHPNHGSGFQTLLRAGRVRDGVDRYRLTPSHLFPAAVEDVRTAVRWLKANAPAQNIDPDRICLWGTSAGGHLAAVAALAPRGTFEGTGNLQHASAVRCVLDAYGPTRFDVMDTQAAQERSQLQTAAVTINVGPTARGSDAPGGRPGRGRAATCRRAGAAAEWCRTTIPRLPSRDCWERLSRPFLTASGRPVQSRMSARTRLPS